MHLIRYSCNEGPFLTNIRAIIADKTTTFGLVRMVARLAN